MLPVLPTAPGTGDRTLTICFYLKYLYFPSAFRHDMQELSSLKSLHSSALIQSQFLRHLCSMSIRCTAL